MSAPASLARGKLWFHTLRCRRGKQGELVDGPCEAVLRGKDRHRVARSLRQADSLSAFDRGGIFRTDWSAVVRQCASSPKNCQSSLAVAISDCGSYNFDGLLRDRLKAKVEAFPHLTTSTIDSRTNTASLRSHRCTVDRSTLAARAASETPAPGATDGRRATAHRTTVALLVGLE